MPVWVRAYPVWLAVGSISHMIHEESGVIGGTYTLAHESSVAVQ
jgi:hypothetical protein